MRPARMTLVSRNTLIPRLALDDAEPGEASRPAIAFFFDQRGDVDRWSVVGGHGRPSDQPPSDFHEFRAARDPFEPDADLVARNLELRARRQARTLPDGGGNHHPTCLVDGSSHAINIPSRPNRRTGEPANLRTCEPANPDPASLSPYTDRIPRAPPSPRRSA